MQYVGSSASGIIDAPIDLIWELVSDPTQHSRIAGSGQVYRTKLLTPEPLGLGTLFRSNQQINGLRYVTVNRIVLWEPPYRVGWRIGFPFAPGSTHTWTFELTPTPYGTRVENGVANIYPVPAMFPFDPLIEARGQDEVKNITPTLLRIADALGADPPTELVERYRAPELAVAQMPSPYLLGGIAWSVAALAAFGLYRRLRS